MIMFFMIIFFGVYSRENRSLVAEFFNNAGEVLKMKGTVELKHKTNPPYCYWNIEELAIENGLKLIGRIASEMSLEMVTNKLLFPPHKTMTISRLFDSKYQAGFNKK